MSNIVAFFVISSFLTIVTSTPLSCDYTSSNGNYYDLSPLADFTNIGYTFTYVLCVNKVLFSIKNY